eukprot:6202145-Pleurochrysis_carterae.AAC.1
MHALTKHGTRTAARSDDPDADADAVKQLLQGEKSRSENLMIVDLVREVDERQGAWRGSAYNSRESGGMCDSRSSSLHRQPSLVMNACYVPGYVG